MVTELTVKDLMPYDKLIITGITGKIDKICTRKGYGYWTVFYPSHKRGSSYLTQHNKELISMLNLDCYYLKDIASITGIKTSKSGKEKIGMIFEQK